MHTTLAFFGGGLGATEVIIILVIALLIFGKRLPEVGKSLGKGIVEFKRGVKGLEDEIDDEVHRPSYHGPEEHEEDEHTREPKQLQHEEQHSAVEHEEIQEQPAHAQGESEDPYRQTHAHT